MAEYTRHALCSFLPEKYSLVNGEEDLGDRGAAPDETADAACGAASDV